MLYQMPDDTRVFVGHDYPGRFNREFRYRTTIGESKTSNSVLKHDTTEEEFTSHRKERDDKLDAPKLLYPSLQVNLLAGNFPSHGNKDDRPYLKTPLTFPSQ
jgi:hypothetical protein